MSALIERSALIVTYCSLLIFTAVTISAQAQSLPAPARTVFKCEDKGKIVYSDEPCLGAKRLDIEPTRGMNQASGKERIGKDVRREKDREAFAEAVRPLTGMDAKQFQVATKRKNLSQQARAECTALDRNIPLAELKERNAMAEGLGAAQSEILTLRRRYRELGC